MRARLRRWMEDTEDPLRHGDITPPAGVELNHPDQASAAEPLYVS
jgi:N-sulfoglucosamine sulfohydrolase